jgi:hypothetical protein
LASWPETWEEAVAVASGATLVVAGLLGAATETVTLSGALVREPSETRSEKVRVAGPAGAEKVGFAALAL